MEYALIYSWVGGNRESAVYYYKDDRFISSVFFFLPALPLSPFNKRLLLFLFA